MLIKMKRCLIAKTNYKTSKYVKLSMLGRNVGINDGTI